jgi:Anion-transporting ATPase
MPTGVISHFDARWREIMNDRAAVHPPGFLADPTRFLFFIGKGGFGKTSIACAAALALANSGKTAVLVSTDPASDLDEILDGTPGQSTGRSPRRRARGLI